MRTWIDIAAQAVCVAASVGGLAVAAWVLVSGFPGREGIDDMFLLVVALTFAVFFGLVPAQAIRRGEWKWFARRAPKPEAGQDRRANA